MDEVEQRKADLRWMNACLVGTRARREDGFDRNSTIMIPNYGDVVIGTPAFEIWEAIAYVARMGNSSSGCTLYTNIDTWAIKDAEMITAAGIRRLVIPESSLTPDFHEVGKGLRLNGIEVAVLSGPIEEEYAQSIALKGSQSFAPEYQATAEMLDELTSGEHLTLVHHTDLQGLDRSDEALVTLATLSDSGYVSRNAIEKELRLAKDEAEVVAVTAKGELGKPVVSRSHADFSEAMAETAVANEEKGPLPSFPWDCVGQARVRPLRS